MDSAAAIYVAGPMSGYPLWNFPAFDQASQFIRSLGYRAVSPAELDRQVGFDETDPDVVFDETDWAEAMRRDYAALLLCDAIALLPGWELSRGAKLERAFAELIGHPVFRLELGDAPRLLPEQIIGFCGYAQSGKDTAAAILTDLGWDRRAFADPIKEIALAMNPRVGDSTLVEAVRHFGWEGAKKSPEVRSLLQRLGTEGGRRHIADDVWTRTLFERPHGPLLVISDVRFEDEVAAIRSRGGIVVRVQRDGVGPANDHPSEAIPSHDLVIDNDGSVADLALEVGRVLASYTSVIAARRRAR